MRRGKLAGLALVLLAPCVPAARAGPLPGVRLETLVPSTTLAFASVDGVATTWAPRWSSTALAKLIAQPEMAAFLKPLGEAAEKLVRETASPGGRTTVLSADAARALTALRGLRGQLAIAWVSAGPDRPPVVSIELDFGEGVRSFVSFLESVRDATETSGRISVGTTTSKGSPLWTFTDGDDPTAVYAAAVGTAFLASTDRAWVEDMVATSAAPVPTPLSASREFLGTRARVGGDEALLFGYVNAKAVLDQVPAFSSDVETVKTARALDLQRVTAAGYGASLRGDGFREALDLRASSPFGGDIGLFRAPGTRHEGLSWAPRTAAAYVETAAALSRALPRLCMIALKFDSDDSMTGVQAWLRHLSETWGVDLEVEFPRGLADETAAWVGFPETGGVFPEVGVAVRVKDASRFEEQFEKLIGGLCRDATTQEVVASQRTINYHGVNLHVVDLRRVEGRAFASPPFTPTWFVSRGWCVATLVPHAAKEIVLRRAAVDATRGGPSGLAADPELSGFLAAAGNAGTWAYFDLKGLAGLLYGTAAPLLQTVVKPNVFDMPELKAGLDFAALPALRTIRPYLKSLGAALTVDDEGMRLELDGPVPAIAIAAAAATVYVVGESSLRNAPGFATGALGTPVTDAEEVTQGALERVGSAAKEYAELRGVLPERLEDLVTKAHLLPRIPKDGWNRDLWWRVDETTGKAVLGSLGADGIGTTADDRTVVVELPSK